MPNKCFSDLYAREEMKCIAEFQEIVVIGLLHLTAKQRVEIWQL